MTTITADARVVINVTGGRGPKGDASGPLAEDSVGADEIKDAPAELAAIREKLSISAAYWWPSVADMLADEDFIYAPGVAGDKAVSAGEYVEVGPYRYEVADTGASDHDLETDGGVKLYVLADSEGRLSPCMWGASPDATASDNQAAFEACLAKIIDTGAAQITPAGTYSFNDTLEYPGGTVTDWDNVEMLKQFDGLGMSFGDGATFVHVHGNLQCNKGEGGSGPITTDENGLANMAGTAADDDGILIRGRANITGVVDALYHHGSGIVLLADTNSNHCSFNLIRGMRTGKYGIECRGTQDDNALWNVNFRGYGCWDSGFHAPDDYNMRSWTGMIATERNCNKGSGDEFYAGKCTLSEIYLYSENHIVGVNEIHWGPNCEWVRYYNVRNTDTVVNATRAATIINISGRNQLLNPVLSYDRCTALQAGSPTRYAREAIETVVTGVNTILREWRTSGDWLRLAVNVGGDLTDSFGFRYNGNFDIMRNGKGIRLVSPDGGTVRYLTIDNSGQIALLSTAP